MSKIKKFILHFSQNKDEESIPNFAFDNLIDVIGFTLAEASMNKVYLISVLDEFFVSCDVGTVLTSTNSFIDSFNKASLWKFEFQKKNIKRIDLFYQEFESYNDAYNFALNMQEAKKLAYSLKQ
jgi:uncharacterized C2H2 Zn-finger protein